MIHHVLEATTTGSGGASVKASFGSVLIKKQNNTRRTERKSIARDLGDSGTSLTPRQVVKYPIEET